MLEETLMSKIDRRVQEAIETEDPDILVDLRHRNVNGSDKYGVFWTDCRKFLDECTTVQGMIVCAHIWPRLYKCL